MSTDLLQPIYAELGRRFAARFKPTLAGPRTVGREAEYPIVTRNGQAADARRLWDELQRNSSLTIKVEPAQPDREKFVVGLEGTDYSYALEVGLGTVEITTRPCRDLFAVAAILNEAMGWLSRAAGRQGWRVLGYGIQPRSKPALSLLTPKQRYLSLYRAMGASWLWYALTASDQVQVAITHGEMTDMLNFGNLMTPVIIALCANSPVYGGALTPYCSAREGEMAAIYAQEHRHGMLPRPVTSAADYVALMAQTTYLIRQDDGEILPSSHPFSDYLLEHGADLDAFLFHEHYMWNSARARAAYSTIEIRPACQQPWPEHMAACALGLGLIEAAEAIDAYVHSVLGSETWTTMQTYHRQVIRYGLAAPLPASDFLRHVLTLAEQGLASRGFGEEGLLQPLFRRLDRRMNPAQRGRALFRIDGLQGLIDHATIPLRATSSRPA